MRSKKGNVKSATVSIALDQRRINHRLKQFKVEGQKITAGELVCHASSRMIYDGPLSGLNDSDDVNVNLAISIGGNAPEYPLIKHASGLDLVQFSIEVKNLSLMHFRGELESTDFGDGLFTFVDLSSLHVVSQVPVLMGEQPLTIGLCDVLPGTVSQQLVCTFDNDVVDCATVARAIGQVREAVEE